MTADVKELTDSARVGAEPPRTQPARGVNGLAEAFARLGYDVEDLLAAAGVGRAELEDPDAPLPCFTVPQMYARARQQRPLKNLAFRMAVETPMGAYPLLDYLVLSCDTVGAAYHQLARYLGLSGSPILFAFHEDENPVRVSLSCPGNVWLIEYTAALSVLHLRCETEDRLRVDSIHFAQRPDDVAEVERVLRCPVRVEEGWSGLSLPVSSWRLPLRRRDPILRAMLERQAGAAKEHPGSEGGDVSRLRRVLASRIAGGDTRIQTIARELAATPRTLQRRLADAGTTFQDVLDGVRREASESYLADSSLSAGEVAQLLGYSEPAAFHRAFKRWTGVTPLEFRGAQRPTPSRSSASARAATEPPSRPRSHRE